MKKETDSISRAVDSGLKLKVSKSFPLQKLLNLFRKKKLK